MPLGQIGVKGPPDAACVKLSVNRWPIVAPLKTRVLLAPSVTLWMFPDPRANVIVDPAVAAMIDPADCVMVRPVVGRSAATMARIARAPLEPFGVARNPLAVSPVVAETASVPLAVRGDPVTVSQDGTVNPTDVRPDPPVRVQTRVVPLNDSPDPRVISEGAAALPVGLPRIVECSRSGFSNT